MAPTSARSGAPTSSSSSASDKKKSRHSSAQKKAARVAREQSERARRRTSEGKADHNIPRGTSDTAGRRDRSEATGPWSGKNSAASRPPAGSTAGRKGRAAQQARSAAGDEAGPSQRNRDRSESTGGEQRRSRSDRSATAERRPQKPQRDRNTYASSERRTASSEHTLRHHREDVTGRGVSTQVPSKTRRPSAKARAQAEGHRPERATPETLAPTPVAAIESTGQSAGGFAELGLDARLVTALTRLGITSPFPIQQATIPDALSGRDLLGRGQTGSGKTMAFGLPMLHQLESMDRAAPHRPHALILTPTRELAMQIVDALSPLMSALKLRHQLIAGGMSYTPQLRALSDGVDVLVATPGRLSDLIERGAADLGGIKITILDEADHMAEMGFVEAISEILNLTPSEGQRMLFSATLDHGVDKVAARYLHDPVTHSTDDASASVSTMDHHLFLVHPHDKKTVTAAIANRSGRTVVFVRTKLGADRIAVQLRESGVFAAALHGGLNQAQRTRVLAAFKSGELPVLVATDVAARGIHVDDVSLVLQADPPADHKDYLHRSGRTARAGQAGAVVTLALPHQRRAVLRLLDQAGVQTAATEVGPDDEAVITTAGGRMPSGEPISQAHMDAVLRPARRSGGGPRRGGNGGARRGGPSSGGRGNSGRPSRGGSGRGDSGRGGGGRTYSNRGKSTG